MKADDSRDSHFPLLDHGCPPVLYEFLLAFVRLQAIQAAEKLSCIVILSEAKNLSSI
jgi:hypothetical protein